MPTKRKSPTAPDPVALKPAKLRVDETQLGGKNDNQTKEYYGQVNLPYVRPFLMDIPSRPSPFPADAIGNRSDQRMAVPPFRIIHDSSSTTTIQPEAPAPVTPWVDASGFHQRLAIRGVENTHMPDARYGSHGTFPLLSKEANVRRIPIQDLLCDSTIENKPVSSSFREAPTTSTRDTFPSLYSTPPSYSHSDSCPSVKTERSLTPDESSPEAPEQPAANVNQISGSSSTTDSFGHCERASSETEIDGDIDAELKARIEAEDARIWSGIQPNPKYFGPNGRFDWRCLRGLSDWDLEKTKQYGPWGDYYKKTYDRPPYLAIG